MNIWENTIPLRKVIPICEYNDSFLYEIIEDYKDAETEAEKDTIFSSFCSSVWASDNKRKIYTKYIKFKVDRNLLQTEPGQVFAAWSDIGYKYYKSVTRDENWRSVLRQKINNIYTRYFDKEVILNKEYVSLLKTPKQLYYQWLSGIDMDAEAVSETIHDAIAKAEKTKIRLQMEKMSLPWNEYKSICEKFLLQAFKNCKRLEEYEDQTKLNTSLDFISEDHFYVSYLCRTLENYFRNYQKTYYHVRRGQGITYSRCKQCRAIIEKTGNKRLYCDRCAEERKKNSWKKASQKYRNKSVIK